MFVYYMVWWIYETVSPGVVTCLTHPEIQHDRCLPLRLRVLVVNLTDVVWTAVVSYFSHLEEDPIKAAKAKAAKALKAKGALITG